MPLYIGTLPSEHTQWVEQAIAILEELIQPDLMQLSFRMHG
ncbi:MAG: hypothetical protein CM1200mP14_09070 [Gammaproteobacteria bacterium]|nr:MAG: hypothetical protein CM1200mP14_09070 [Gammaproteobacteria bacterium]